MGYIYPESNFYNAQNAFIMLYDMILKQGTLKEDGTKALFNMGFYITNPSDMDINVEWRKWNRTYAEREWRWYLSEDRSVEELKKHAPIWDRMHGGDNMVNSNYGFLWNENRQLQNAIDKLWNTKESRQAWVTLYDGKRMNEYTYDTPCTLGLGFSVHNGALCMNVQMRSNDLWFGFCNDQFCFANLQEYVAGQLDLPVGWYYHFAADLHLYPKHLNAREDFYKSLKYI